MPETSPTSLEQRRESSHRSFRMYLQHVGAHMSGLERLLEENETDQLELPLQEWFQESWESLLAEGDGELLDQLVAFSKDKHIPLDFKSQGTLTAFTNGVTRSFIFRGVGGVRGLLKLGKTVGIPFELVEVIKNSVDQILSKGHGQVARNVFTFAEKEGVTLDFSEPSLAEATLVGICQRVEEGYAGRAQELVTLAKKNTIQINLQDPRLLKAFETGFIQLFGKLSGGPGYVDLLDQMTNFAKKNGLRQRPEVFPAIFAMLNSSLVEALTKSGVYSNDLLRSFAPARFILGYIQKQKLPLDLTRSFKEALQRVEGDSVVAEAIRTLAIEFKVSI